MTTLIQSLTSKPRDTTDDRTGNWNTKVADNKREGEMERKKKSACLLD